MVVLVCVECEKWARGEYPIRKDVDAECLWDRDIRDLFLSSVTGSLGYDWDISWSELAFRFHTVGVG